MSLSSRGAGPLPLQGGFGSSEPLQGGFGSTDSLFRTGVAASRGALGGGGTYGDAGGYRGGLEGGHGEGRSGPDSQRIGGSGGGSRPAKAGGADPYSWGGQQHVPFLETEVSSHACVLVQTILLLLCSSRHQTPGVISCFQI